MPNSSSDRLILRKGNSQQPIFIFSCDCEFKAHVKSNAAFAIGTSGSARCDVVTADVLEFHLERLNRNNVFSSTSSV